MAGTLSGLKFICRGNSDFTSHLGVFEVVGLVGMCVRARVLYLVVQFIYTTAFPSFRGSGWELEFESLLIT